MNKRMLCLAVVFTAVAMFALPVSLVSATKPVTMTLTGTYYITGAGDSYNFQADESGNFHYMTRNAPCLWTGDISGTSTNHGNWLTKGGPLFVGDLAVAVMSFKLEDVTVTDVGGTGFVGTGDLSLGMKSMTVLYIKSGTGDLRSIRGEGTITMVNPAKWNYEFEVQINP